VENAHKHKDKPELIDDAMRAINAGCGMEREFIEARLFKPFERGMSEMGTGAQGVRETARASGGELDVESVLDKGTKIPIVLLLAP